MKKYYTLTLGCQMNKLDSEKLDTVLQKIGFVQTANENEADLINVLACSVRQTAIDRIHGKIKHWQNLKSKKPLVTFLTGCVLPKDKAKLGKQFDILLDTRELSKFPQLLSTFYPQHTKFHNCDYFNLPTQHRNSFQAYIPISYGCDKFCTYCAVPYTRGREINRPAKDIVYEAKKLIKNGCKEIFLLGQTVNSYTNPEKNDEIKSFTDLLRVLAHLDGNFWIRFASPYPTHFTDELIKTIAEEPKICKHLHLPIQSGSNAVLKKMLRKYSREDYLKLINKIRKAIPEAAITTDIIVGFCGETEKDFQYTLDIYKKVKFDMAYPAQFSVRVGTQAQKRFIDNVLKIEKTRRFFELNKLIKKYSFENNKKYLNRVVKVLIDSKNNNALFGRTETNKPIKIINGANENVGKFALVKITKTLPWNLAGKIV